jgi:hypothetical protein
LDSLLYLIGVRDRDMGAIAYASSFER